MSTEEIGFHRRAALEKLEKQGRTLPATFGPKPGHLRRQEIERQIEAMTARLMGRVAKLEVKLTDGGLHELVRIGKVLTAMITSTEPAAREQGARVIADTLLDVGERSDGPFWSTDLGRAIAREIGWLAPQPSKLIARHVLHVSRQAVDQMVQRGDLEPGGGPCVTRDSLRQAAAKRWPYDSDV